MTRIGFVIFSISVVIIGIGTIWAYTSNSHTEEGGDEPREVATVDYVCTEGSLSANYAPNKVTLLLSDGRSFTLPQTIAASGIRFATADESIVFWSKGTEAFMEESGMSTYSHCVAAGDRGSSIEESLPLSTTTVNTSAIGQGGTTSYDRIPVGDCYIGGCSGQICSDEPDIASTCEWRDEYACYSGAICERQTNGACGWTLTQEQKACLHDARMRSSI